MRRAILFALWLLHCRLIWAQYDDDGNDGDDGAEPEDDTCYTTGKK
jgi:hypothetical protein